MKIGVVRHAKKLSEMVSRLLNHLWWRPLQQQKRPRDHTASLATSEAREVELAWKSPKADPKAQPEYWEFLGRPQPASNQSFAA